MRSRTLLFAAMMALWVLGARAQEPFIGEVRMFAGNFAPRGWALCDGQLLPISSNTALFSILGTTYGGDGRTSFGLPDLRGRFPMHPGNGPGLTTRQLGQKSGQETVTLTANQIPSHTHTAVMQADSGVGDSDDPTGKVPARNASSTPVYSDSSTVALDSSAVVVGSGGGGQPHNNMPPFLCVNYIIALQGIFPSRD